MRAEIEAGFRSRASIISELGYDVADVDAERAADAEREAKLGIIAEDARLAEAQARKLEAEVDAAQRQAEAAKHAASEARALAAAASDRARITAMEASATQLGLDELKDLCK